MRRIATTVILALCAAPPLLCQQADLVIQGRVWTGDGARPSAEALAGGEGRIIAVGTRAQVRRHIGRATRVIDNGSGLVVPGFGDAHPPFLEGGFQLISVDLRDADTP